MSLFCNPILWISDSIWVTQLTHVTTALLWTKVVWLTGDLNEASYLTNFLWCHCRATYHVIYKCLVWNWLHKCLFYTWDICSKKKKQHCNICLFQGNIPQTPNLAHRHPKAKFDWLRRGSIDQLVSRLNQVVYTPSVSYLRWYLAWAEIDGGLLAAGKVDLGAGSVSGVKMLED